jgi:hypothetical protein
MRDSKRKLPPDVHAKLMLSLHFLAYLTLAVSGALASPWSFSQQQTLAPSPAVDLFAESSTRSTVSLCPSSSQDQSGHRIKHSPPLLSRCEPYSADHGRSWSVSPFRFSLALRAYPDYSLTTPSPSSICSTNASLHPHRSNGHHLPF